MISFFERLLNKRPMFSDGEIDLLLSNEDPTDPKTGIVDGYTFHIIDRKTKKYAGYVSLRIGESASLYYLGHIGYRVQPEYRGNRYARRACEMIRPFIKKLGIHSLVITTDVDNLPSRATCEHLGCTQERIAPVPKEYRYVCSGSTMKCRYIWRID